LKTVTVILNETTSELNTGMVVLGQNRLLSFSSVPSSPSCMISLLFQVVQGWCSLGCLWWTSLWQWLFTQQWQHIPIYLFWLVLHVQKKCH